jgi:hypothetical protein
MAKFKATAADRNLADLKALKKSIITNCRADPSDIGHRYLTEREAQFKNSITIQHHATNRANEDLMLATRDLEKAEANETRRLKAEAEAAAAKAAAEAAEAKAAAKAAAAEAKAQAEAATAATETAAQQEAVTAAVSAALPEMLALMRRERAMREEMAQRAAERRAKDEKEKWEWANAISSAKWIPDVEKEEE